MRSIGLRAASLLLLVAPLLAQTHWFGGHWDPCVRLSLKNAESAKLGTSRVFDDFLVPEGDPVTIDRVWSDNFSDADRVLGGRWEIRAEVSEGCEGLLVASGVLDEPTWTPTGVVDGELREFTLEGRLDTPVTLVPGTYWLAVWPLLEGEGGSQASVTTGEHAVGQPVANGNAFYTSDQGGKFFTSVVAVIGVAADFALGARVGDPWVIKVLPPWDNHNSSYGRAINDNNVVVGMSINEPQVPSSRAVVWRLEGEDYAIQWLMDRAPGSATGINRDGLVAGNWRRQPPQVPFKFLWEPGYLGGAIIDLVDPWNMPSTFTLRIDSQGTVAGAAMNARNRMRAVKWDAQGRFTNLHHRDWMDDDTHLSHGTAINDVGMITINYTTLQGMNWFTDAFVLGADGTTLTPLAKPAGAQSVEAWGISGHGKVCGGQVAADRSVASRRALVWTDAAPTVLQDLLQSSVAMAINRDTRIVGTSFGAGGARSEVYWSSIRARPVAVSSLLAAADARRWEIDRVEGINENHWMVGAGRLQGARRGFVIRPP